MGCKFLEDCLIYSSARESHESSAGGILRDGFKGKCESYGDNSGKCPMYDLKERWYEMAGKLLPVVVELRQTLAERNRVYADSVRALEEEWAAIRDERATVGGDANE